MGPRYALIWKMWLHSYRWALSKDLSRTRVVRAEPCCCYLDGFGYLEVVGLGSEVSSREREESPGFS